jgi:hypothetical protein
MLDLSERLRAHIGAATFKEAIKPVVNNHQGIASSRLRVNQSDP